MPHSAVRRLGSAVLDVARRSRVDEPERAFLADVGRACAGRGGPPAVAVLAPPTGVEVDVAALVSRSLPDARVTVLDPSLDRSSVHAALAAAGPFDVVVDASRDGEARVALFRRTFLHVRQHGSYIAWDVTVDTQGLGSGSGETILGFVARLLELRSRPRPEPRKRYAKDSLILARAIDRVSVGSTHLVVVSNAAVLPMLSEAEATGVLEIRGPSLGRVVHRLERVRFPSRATVTHVPASRTRTSPQLTHEPGTFDVPAMSLREYAGVLCQPGMVAILDGMILPDTYRKAHKPRPRNKFIIDSARGFAVPRHQPTEVGELSGAFFYLDSEWRGHYGHAMTEQLSRLWAWPQAKQAEPGLRVLMSAGRKWPRLNEFEKVLYAAAGIPSEDLVLVDGPVRVERLYAASPMFDQPRYVHPDLLHTWTTVSRALAAQAPEQDQPRRFFCARRGAHRSCRNADEVEALFARFGFAIVYPERLSLPEQATMFRNAEVVAGYAGSAMLNLALTESAKRVVLIGSDGYSAKNEYLISSVLGHRMDVVWCHAETPMPEHGFSLRAYKSAFTMDLEQEGRELTEILAGLTTEAEWERLTSRPGDGTGGRLGEG